MDENWEQVKDVQTLKYKINKHNLDKYQLNDFKFERAGNNTREYYVYYKENHVETYSMDTMDVERIKEKLEEMKLVEPESKNE
jgi:hypothetical protein